MCGQWLSPPHVTLPPGIRTPRYTIKPSTMAKITPVRPKYWRKYNPVVYVVNKRMYARARAASIYNPRTLKQQANRSKMSVASRFLAQMQPMVARGFKSRMTNRPGWESRRVGAYHVALGELLRSGMRKGADAWEVDYQNVKLSEGNSLDMYPMEISRSGREMRISFPKGLPRGTRRVRVAVHAAGEGRTVHIAFDAPRRGEELRLSIPKWAASGGLHVYYTVEVKGKSRWASAYVYVPKGRGGAGRGRGGAVVSLGPMQNSKRGSRGRSEGRRSRRGGVFEYSESPPCPGEAAPPSARD